MHPLQKGNFLTANVHKVKRMGEIAGGVISSKFEVVSTDFQGWPFKRQPSSALNFERLLVKCSFSRLFIPVFPAFPGYLLCLSGSMLFKHIAGKGGKNGKDTGIFFNR